VRRLVSVGNVLVDITAQVGSLPERGGEVVASGSRLAPGGSFNVLVAATRQGLPGAYAGASGTGPFGDLVRAGLRDAGLEVLVPPTHDLDTGYDITLVEPDGERCFVTAFGAEATLSEQQLAELSLQPGDAVHVSGYGLLDRTNGATIPPWLLGLRSDHVVVFDPGPLVADIPQSTLRAVLERADWVSCNEGEARQLTGQQNPEHAVETLTGQGAGVVVRLGPAGCVVGYNGRTVAVAGFPVRAVDTTGAGDAHVGAFVAALARGLDPVQAARRANACASIAVGRFGSATAASSAEVDELLAR